MKTMPPTDVNQAALWNGHAGHAWVASQTALDQMFQPLEDQLVEAVSTQRAQHVLDVGCGTGSTTLAIARQLGAVMRENHLTKSMLARRMRTSRAQLDRLLDPDNDSVTLGTLTRASHAVGRNLRMELVQCEGLPCEAAPGGEAGA